MNRRTSALRYVLVPVLYTSLAVVRWAGEFGAGYLNGWGAGPHAVFVRPRIDDYPQPRTGTNEIDIWVEVEEERRLTAGWNEPPIGLPYILREEIGIINDCSPPPVRGFHLQVSGKTT